MLFRSWRALKGHGEYRALASKRADGLRPDASEEVGVKILVPVKRVVDANIKVRVKADGSGVETLDRTLTGI